MSYTHFFWLHVKKSAGSSIRQLLSPHYVEVERKQNPQNFIQSRPEEYNDVLNNYRVVLGDYQFKRCLFASRFLYPESWHRLYSFAFAREPVDRCISMFFYLYWQKEGVLERLVRCARASRRSGRIVLSTSYAFDAFLDFVQQARQGDSIYYPLGNHFSTHTAPVWDDITDHDGNILLTDVFRLEALYTGINAAFEQCGIDKRVSGSNLIVNRNIHRKSYTPSARQIGKIEEIYPRDFEVYENATH